MAAFKSSVILAIIFVSQFFGTNRTRRVLGYSHSPSSRTSKSFHYTVSGLCDGEKTVYALSLE